MRKFSGNGSGWSRSALAILIAHSLLIQVITFAFRPTLSYAALDAGLPPSLLGLLSAAFALPGVLLALPTGRIADRVSERIVVVAGGVLVLAAALLALFAHGALVAIVLATVLFGMGHLVSVVGDQALLANRTTNSRRDSIFGAYAFSISLGQGVGGGLLAIGSTGSSQPDILLQCFLAAGVAIATVAVATLMRGSGSHAQPLPSGGIGVGALVRSPGVARAIVASSMVIVAMEISLVYFPAIGYERGFAVATVSAMLVARSIASMASRLGLGWQIRVIGRRRLMVGSIAVSAVCIAALALPLDPVWLIVVCAVFGFSNGVCQPLTLSWLSEIAPPGRRGTVMSLRVATNRVAQAALPLAVGGLAATTGAGGVLIATGALLGVASWMSSAIGATPPDDAPVAEGSAA